MKNSKLLLLASTIIGTNTLVIAETALMSPADMKVLYNKAQEIVPQCSDTNILKNSIYNAFNKLSPADKKEVLASLQNLPTEAETQATENLKAELLLVKDNQ